MGVLTRYALFVVLVALCGALGLLWWQSGKVDALRSENDRLTRNAAVAEDKATLAKAAAVTAQKERARMAVQSAKYETVRDAFRKGNFDDPLPDDFRHLIACVLRSAAGRDTPDCP